MAAILRDSTVVVVVVAVVRTRPRAIPLSMNPYMGFFFLYGYGAPLGGPSGRRSSAIIGPLKRFDFSTLFVIALTQLRVA